MIPGGVLVGVPIDPDRRRNIPFVPKVNSVIVNCSTCKDLVWIGPKQREQFEDGMPVDCCWCIIKKAKEQGIDPRTLEIRMLNPKDE